MIYKGGKVKSRLYIRFRMVGNEKLQTNPPTPSPDYKQISDGVLFYRKIKILSHS
jgi:hypothetical protein